MKKEKIRTLIVIIFLILVSLYCFIDARGSFLEYKELGEKYISIYKTQLMYKYLVIAINFVIIALIMYITGRKIRKGLKVFFEKEKKEMPRLPNKSITLIVATIVSIIEGNILLPKIITALNQGAFVEADGIFNLDISFFMFTLPLIKTILMYGIYICIGLIIYSAIYYILVFNKYFDGIDRDILKQSDLIKNIIKYIRFIAINFSLYTIIRTFDIVYDNFIKTSSGLELIGAGKVDLTIKIMGTIILAILILIAVFLATSNFKKENNSKALKNLLIVPAYMVIMFVVLIGFDLIFVHSNEYDKEKGGIEKNISYTQKAYNIKYDESNIEYSGTITGEDVEENENILNNIAIINKNEVLNNLNDEQTEKGYYTYKTAGISEYNGNIVYMSPKEISNNRRTYNVKTFENTHGYGVISTSAVNTTEEGGLVYKQIEELNKPQIYYGLETNNIVVTNSDSKEEFDYIDSKGNEYNTSYEGNSGLSLNFFDRLVLGIKKGSPNIAFSGNVNRQSKILINRNIILRAKLALSGSNIIYDENPYIVVDDSKNIYWILDAFTISDNYPNSTYTTIQINGERKRINYIRNSIKVIISAYDGNMKFYLTDDTDPIAMTYKKTYSELFENKEQLIPSDISKYFIYPEFLYNIQASIIEEYHNTKPEVLYRSDDSWSKVNYVTTQNNKTVNNRLNAYYTSIKQGDLRKIGLIQFYTPKDKQNLTAYLIGTTENGINNLKIYKISSDSTILGLTQLDYKISQDEMISKELEKLNVTGARVTKNMMVIPVNKTLLYIEEIYQTKQNESELPKLKKIIVASGNKVAIGNSLSEAIENIISREATSIDIYTTEDMDGIIQSIIKANNNLNKSMDSKDLELIGSDIKKLQELILQLEKEHEKQKQKEKENTQNVEKETNNEISESVKEDKTIQNTDENVKNEME